MPRKPIDARIQEMLKNMSAGENPDLDLRQEAIDDSAEDLRLLYERFNNGKEQRLRPGTLARWKPGMKNYRLPAYNQPAIVIKILDVPLNAEPDESGSPYFCEPLDLLLGVRFRDGAFLVYHFDRRRFEPFEPEEI